MAVTFAEAAKRVNDGFIAGVAQSIVTVDQFMQALPVDRTPSYKIDFNYLATRQAAEVIAAGGNITEGASTSTEVSIYPERIVREVKIPNTLSATDAVFQLQQGAVAVGEALASQLVVGTGVHATPELASLASYTGTTAGTQVIDAGGTALSFTYLDQIVHAVKVGMNKALVMNSSALFKFNALMRAAGGVPMTEIAGGLLKVPSFNGVPVLCNDFIPSTDPGSGYGSTDTSVYCIALDPEYVKLWLKVDTIGAESYDNMFEVLGPYQATGSDNQSWKIGLSANLMIRSPQAIARLYRCSF